MMDLLGNMVVVVGNEWWNESGKNYVAWCWKAGGTLTVANNDGDVTSQVSVNDEAGFSIVKFTFTEQVEMPLQ